MKTILLLYHGSGSPKARLQNVPGSDVIQHSSEATLVCNCDRWGHPFPDHVEHNVKLENHDDTKTLSSKIV